jgi:hypothetical protein
MFRASSCPSSRATTSAVAASGLPSERGGSSAVGRGPAGRQMQPSEILQSVLDNSIRIESKGERLNEGVSEQNPENNIQT